MKDDTDPRTLFVFMDESGDLQFGTKGKQHFILSAVYTDEPHKLAAVMQELKYEQMKRGSQDLDFHATNNSVGTRKRVLDVLCRMEGLRVHSLWIDKAFTHPNLQDEVLLLAMFGKAMGKWIHTARSSGYDQIIMTFDSVLTGKKQDAFKKKLAPQLKATGKKFRLLFQPVKQDLNGQIADYFSWSLFRALESGDTGSYDRLKASTEWTNFNLFHHGQIRYW